MTNDEFEEDLRQLLFLTSHGELLGLSLYPQACIFLFQFAPILGQDIETVKEQVKEGIDIYIFEKMHLNTIEQTDIQMIKHFYSDAKIREIIQFIENRLNEVKKGRFKK